MAAKPLPDIAYLRECLEYNPATGVLTWKERPKSHFRTDRARAATNGRFAGTVVGRNNRTRYIVACFDRDRHLAHRVAWALAYGVDPGDLEIDHINGDGCDNRLSNLRLANHRQNSRNGRLRSNSSSGLKGACYDPRQGRWRSYIVVDGRQIHLGDYRDAETAHAAYALAARQFHGEFAGKE